MKAVEAKVDEVGVVFDREEERKELAPITVISTISLEVNNLKTPSRCHHHHLNVISTISLEVNTLKNLSKCHFDHLHSTLRDQQQYTLPHQSVSFDAFFFQRGDFF